MKLAILGLLIACTGTTSGQSESVPVTNTSKSVRSDKSLGDSQSRPAFLGIKANRKKRPNVLLVVCDDLNSHVTPMGYKQIQTPNLAKLAAESITFQNAYCQYPVCGPSRASFLSGLYPHSTGIFDNKADIRVTRPDTMMLPQFLKQNGYWTANVGKIFHAKRHEHAAINWDECIHFDNDELPAVTRARQKFVQEFGSVNKSANRARWKEIVAQVESPLKGQTPPGHGKSGLADEQHKDGKSVRQVASWLRNKSYGDQPFFIACGIQKPHVPFLAPAHYFDMYPTTKIEFPTYRENLWDSIPKNAMGMRYRVFGFEIGKENPGLRRKYIQAYHACISFVDAQLKVLFDALKKNGNWEDTIVIFTSDHGFHLGEHFLWGKVTLFDIGTRVPLIVRVPGLSKNGSNSNAMVELIDLYPSIADLAGLPAPQHLQGKSIRPDD